MSDATPVHSGLVTYHPDLAGLLMPIDDIRQHPDNYNNGDIAELCTSIETNGMYRPVYVQRSSGYIVAGNSTWEACKSLDATEIPVIWLDIDDLAAKRILLADNQIASLAVPDPALLLPLLDEIAELDSLMGTGFAEHDMARLRKLSAPPPPVSEDFTTWPVLCFQVPPESKRAYLQITDEAGGDLERFHLLLRLAGWNG